MTSLTPASDHLSLSFLASPKTLSFFTQTTATLSTFEMFDILLLYHKPGNHFLLTAQHKKKKKKKPGPDFEGRAVDVLWGSAVLMVWMYVKPSICCPAWLSTLTLSVISGVFYVQSPAELLQTTSLAVEKHKPPGFHSVVHMCHTHELKLRLRQQHVRRWKIGK